METNYQLTPQREGQCSKAIQENEIVSAIEQKTASHPCYNGCNKQNARMHLPVAPKCNIQCNYCVRKFDCANESRPGVTTRLLSPEEAFEKFKETKEKMQHLIVVGIAGPGDALCEFEKTKKTLELIRAYDKEITFCLSTNGLLLPDHADELVELGVTHITVTLNSLDPMISAQIYKYVDYKEKRYVGVEAGERLMKNQLEGLQKMIDHGAVCKVNIVMLKGINDQHIKKITKTVKAMGCYIVNIMPFIPVKGSVFEDKEKSPLSEVLLLRKECEETILQMHHCKQCRADAVGCL